LHIRLSALLLICCFALACVSANAACIALRPNATWTERAAAGDLQRVIYAATGKQLPIGPLRKGDRDVIALGFSPVGGVDLSAKALGDQGFVLKTVTRGDKTILVAAGANPVSTSYAAYTLAERYGAGFYLGGDALPTKRTAFAIPKLDVVSKPVFKIRGVLPWYNFFDSPTAWNIEDYRSFIDQLAKSKNNFLGFHSYDGEPFCAYRDTDGKMVAGAPLLSTNQPTWGTASMKTSEFAPGVRGYFDKPYFGADCSMGYKTPEEGIKNAQKLLARALWYAKARGVKTCVGFEVGADPTTPGELDKLERRLKSVLKAYPMLDYIWIWEPEAMGLRGVEPHPARTDFGAYYRRWDDAFSYITDARRRTEAVRVGIYAQAAYRIIRREAPGVRMILSAWGGDNHLRFTDFYPGYDKILPKDVIFSALDNIVVSDTVSTAYGKLSKDREFWPIPWFEYDGDQWCPQPNTKRFYNAARDAVKKGASGLLAIHWRTRDVEESHAYISQFAWNPNLGYEEFYRDYARKAYGDENAAKLLMDLQDLGWRWLGGGGQSECGGFAWSPAPDGAVERMRDVFTNHHSVQPSEKLADLVCMREWLSDYDGAARILRSDAAVRTLLRRLTAENRPPTSLEKSLLESTLWQAQASLELAIDSAARRMSNRGELGILATINAKAWASLLEIEKQAREIAGIEVKARSPLDTSPIAVRSILQSDTAFAGQPMRISAVVRAASPKAKAEVLYRAPSGSFHSAALKFVASGRLEGHIPASSVGLIEYYVRVTDGPNTRVWPSGAPKAPACVSVVPAPPVGEPAKRAASSALGTKAHVTVSTGPLLVQLSWPESISTRAFEIRRSPRAMHSPLLAPGDAEWVPIATVRDNWFEDRNVEVGDQYRYSYRIFDADSGRLLAESDSVKIPEPPLPSAPVLSALAGPGRVRLSWIADGTDCSGYDVYRADKPDGPFVVTGHPRSQLEVQSPDTYVCRAEPGRQYYYAVGGISLDGKDGPISEPVCATAVEADAKPIVSLNFDGSDAASIRDRVVEQGIPSVRVGAGSFVELPHQAAFNPESEVSVQFWLKMHTPGVMPVFISHGAWNQDGFFLQYYNSQVRFWLGGVGCLDAGGIEMGRWTAVTATYDGAEMALYVNGREVGSQPASGLIISGAHSLFVGRYEYESKEFEIDGWIGGVRLYPYAVSPEAAQAHYEEMVHKMAGGGS
jgi:hypothetical protein